MANLSPERMTNGVVNGEGLLSIVKKILNTLNVSREFTFNINAVDLIYDDVNNYYYKDIDLSVYETDVRLDFNKMIFYATTTDINGNIDASTPNIRNISEADSTKIRYITRNNTDNAILKIRYNDNVTINIPSTDRNIFSDTIITDGVTTEWEFEHNFNTLLYDVKIFNENNEIVDMEVQHNLNNIRIFTSLPIETGRTFKVYCIY